MIHFSVKDQNAPQIKIHFDNLPENETLITCQAIQVVNSYKFVTLKNVATASIWKIIL